MPFFDLFLILNGRVQGLCNTGTVEKMGKKEAALALDCRNHPVPNHPSWIASNKKTGLFFLLV